MQDLSEVAMDRKDLGVTSGGTAAALADIPEKSKGQIDRGPDGPAGFPGQRRSFLGMATGLIGAGIAAFLGLTLGRYSILPTLAEASGAEWLEVGPVAEIPEGKPENRSVIVSRNAGWGSYGSQQSVWVVRTGERLTVFSTVCPHLGCTITDKANGFGCLCHSSYWGPEGEKLGGPAPRAMDVLEHEVKDGTLRVKYQNFKQGVAEKQAAD